MVKFLGNVQTPKVVIILAAAMNARVEMALPGDLTVTSANDSVHMKGSKHYTDEALDFRTKDITADEAKQWGVIIKRRLGADYDIVLEVDHLHVEHDDHKKV